ncbi:hypothetical protein VTO73DRAFT_10730 [Trametes versicolor]
MASNCGAGNNVGTRPIGMDSYQVTGPITPFANGRFVRSATKVRCTAYGAEYEDTEELKTYPGSSTRVPSEGLLAANDANTTGLYSNVRDRVRMRWEDRSERVRRLGATVSESFMCIGVVLYVVLGLVPRSSFSRLVLTTARRDPPHAGTRDLFVAHPHPDASALHAPETSGIMHHTRMREAFPRAQGSAPYAGRRLVYSCATCFCCGCHAYTVSASALAAASRHNVARRSGRHDLSDLARASSAALRTAPCRRDARLGASASSERFREPTPPKERKSKYAPPL